MAMLFLDNEKNQNLIIKAINLRISTIDNVSNYLNSFMTEVVTI